MVQFKQNFISPSKAEIARVSKENDISLLLAELLLSRGLQTYDEIQSFLTPTLEQLHDPFLLPDMHKAVARIMLAIKRKEQICVLGDYDVDGVCATAILYQYLCSVGAKATVYLPSRFTDGYGMNENSVRSLFDQGIKLIITVDNGISSLKEIALCNELGLSVIVTDHHQPSGILPVCEGVVNPKIACSEYPNQNLCGAGVSFKLVQALGGLEAAEPYLGLSALATVADVVELKGENRVIAALGLGTLAKHTGISALLEVSGSSKEQVTEDVAAFRLAPRLNAAGRMGHPNDAFKLLLESDAAKARSLALLLNDYNVKRQEEEHRITQAAKDMLAARDVAAMHAIILFSSDWNRGVIGIVASKLAETYNRPVLLFHKKGELLTGSSRSIPGINIFECLQAFQGMFERFGGHAQAAGLTIAYDKFNLFAQEFDNYLKNNISPLVFRPTMLYEMELPFGALSTSVISEISRLAPFGEGNPQPVFRSRRVRLENLERIGKDSSHLRAIAVQGVKRLQLVAFGYGHNSNDWQRESSFDILYVPESNTWQGENRLQLMLRAAKATSFFEQTSVSIIDRNKFYDAFFQNFLYNEGQETNTTKMNSLDSLITRSLKNRIYGTLILCAFQEGARNLKKLLVKEGLEDAVNIYWSELPKDAPSDNAILLAPILSSLQENRYLDTFFYDYTSCFKLPKVSSNVYVSEAKLEKAFLLPIRISRDAMADIYRKLVNRLKSGPASMLCLHKDLALEYPILVLGVLVFIELGFMLWDKETETVCLIDKCTPRDLKESSLYCTAFG